MKFFERKISMIHFHIYERTHPDLDEFLQNDFIQDIIHIFHMRKLRTLQMFLLMIVDESNFRELFVNILFNEYNF